MTSKQTNISQDTGSAQDNDRVSRADLVAVMQSRSATYGLLSRLYRKEVDRELLDQMHAAHYRVSTGSPDVDEGHRLIATYLSGIWENTLTELAADFQRTFFGHGYDSHAAAYPFESIYTAEKRLLMQDARDEVLALYRSSGLDKNKKWKEGEDHVALELEYMQILAARCAKALKESDDTEALSLIKRQLNFLKEHLITWVPYMTQEMEKFSRTDFYRGLGYMTDGFLSNDRDALEDLLSQDD